MLFLNAVIKGLGWGIGLGTGIFIAATVFQIYQENRIESKSMEHFRGAYGGTPVTEQQFNLIEPTTSKISMVSGTIIVTGLLTNNTDQPLRQVSLLVTIRKGDLPIEKCHGVTDNMIQKNTSEPFAVICNKVWHDLTASDVNAQLKVTGASNGTAGVGKIVMNR